MSRRQKEIPRIRKLFSKKASISLESVLIFPLFLSIIYLGIWAVNTRISQYKVISLINEELQISGYDNIFFDYLEDGIKELKMSDFLKDMALGAKDLSFMEYTSFRINYSINELFSSNRRLNKFIKLEKIYPELSLDQRLYMHIEYKLFYPFSREDKVYTVPIVMWSSRRSYRRGSLHEYTGSIWDEDNFTRGKFFQDQLGANLPHGFPQISSYENGEIGLIKSMDLNKKTWENPEAVREEVCKQIDGLSAYSGNEKPWGKDQIYIRKEDISSRTFKLVVPEDYSREKYDEIFKEITSYSNSRGVHTTIVPYK